MRTVRIPVLVVFFFLLCASALLLAACGDEGLYGEGGEGPGGGAPGGASQADDTTPPGGPSEAGATGGDEGATDSTSPSGLDLDTVRQWLAAAPFAYVAEGDIEMKTPGDVASAAYTAAFAIVDSASDTLASRPECEGRQPVNLAVAPDGSLVYVTDWGRPVIHVLDAETKTHLRDIDLPGVEPADIAAMQACVSDPNAAAPWDWSEGCGGGIATTPDGASLLVTTKVGVMVIDRARETVVRTFPEINAHAVAVSFDGRRAYLGTSDFPTRGPRTVLEWLELRNQGAGGGLAILDLETWQVTLTREIGHANGIAVRPDDSEVYVSDHAQKALRIVDALTLEDRGLVPLGTTSFPVGVAVLPDGSKAYVVMTADNTDIYSAVAERRQPQPPTADEFFCAVIDTGRQEVIKRIPLETY